MRSAPSSLAFHFVLLLLVAVLPARLRAANAVVGAGTPASCDEAALDAAIATANAGGGTITFACGADPIVLPITTMKSLTASVTIDADQLVTLDAGGSTRHFEITGLIDCTLRDLRLIRGAAADGGAVRVSGSWLRLERVEIENSVATGDGGAVAVTSSSVIVRDSRLAGNEAGGSGGAIRQVGGALDIGETILTRNQAAGDGGAIAIANHSQFAVLLSSVDGNVAGGDGGGIDAHAGTGFVDQSQVVWNVAGGKGGALHFGGPASMTFSQDTFGRNVAAEGGALFLEPGTVSQLSQVTLSNNEAESAISGGGAIANLGTLQLENSTVSGNVTLGSGGGILNEGSTTLRMVTLAYNLADVGGGIASSGATLHLRNVILAQDSASSSGDECAVSGGFDVAATLWAGTSCGSATTGGNQPSTDALLQPLGFSCPPGVPEKTRTHDLDPASPARDTGIVLPGGTAFMDQRGVLRPQGSSINDIGAVEFVPNVCPFLFRDDFEAANTFAWSSVLP